MAFSETIKLRVKIRADFTCCWCRDRRNKIDIHHIIPQAENGTDDEGNAAPLCGSCHDLYGGNPELRKEIRLRRDQWYELCARINAERQALEDHSPPPDMQPSVQQSVGKPQPSIDFVIVTALEEERDAVLDKLPTPQKLSPFEDDIRVYYQSDLPVTFPNGASSSYRIIVMPLLGMGRLQAATATSDAIRRWHPRYVILVGIAGGVAEKGVKLGDILISTQIVDYELQKLTPADPEIRWEVHRADPRLLGAARNLSDKNWPKLLKTSRPGPGQIRRHMGPIASGDKVIAFGEILEKHCDIWPTLIGVEMEAAGVAATAFQAAVPPGFFMVRSVSDLADERKGSSSAKKWRPYACDVAAAYTIALLKSGPVPLREAKNRPV